MNASHQQNTAQKPLFYIQKGNQQYGPCNWEEIAAALKSGDLRTSDYLWCNGLKDWQTIGSFLSAKQQQHEPGFIEELKTNSPLRVMFGAILWMFLLALAEFIVVRQSDVSRWINAVYDLFPWLPPVVLVAIGLAIWLERKGKLNS